MAGLLLEHDKAAPDLQRPTLVWQNVRSGVTYVGQLRDRSCLHVDAGFPELAPTFVHALRDILGLCLPGQKKMPPNKSGCWIQFGGLPRAVAAVEVRRAARLCGAHYASRPGKSAAARGRPSGGSAVSDDAANVSGPPATNLLVGVSSNPPNQVAEALLEERHTAAASPATRPPPPGFRVGRANTDLWIQDSGPQATTVATRSASSGWGDTARRARRIRWSERARRHRGLEPCRSDLSAEHTAIRGRPGG